MNKEYYYNQINKVLIYIQENVDRKINIKELADIAGFSEFHFCRIFNSYVGETLGSFVKRIKLEKAAHKIKYENLSMLDISNEVGYETPAAFTRSFKQYFGVSPSEYKQNNNRAYFIQKEPEYYCYLKELIMKNYLGIREQEDLNVIYARKTGKYTESAWQAWDVLFKFAYPKNLITPESKCIGVCYDDPSITEEEKLRYDACITVKEEIADSDEVKMGTIKGGRYAVFLHEGSYENLIETYTAAFREWLPNSNEKLRDLPTYERYLNDPKITKPEDLKTEIYLPVE